MECCVIEDQLAYPFGTVDNREAPPSSERPRGSEEGHRFAEKLAGEVNGYQLASLGERYRQSGRRLVLTNGCFDLLHTGHVRYLQQARSLGDALLIAVNSDRSVQELKGPTRPLNSEQDRAEVLLALRCVDYVTIFDQLRVTEVIQKLQPAVYVKGGDYTINTLDMGEREALVNCKAEVKILSLVPGRSTTHLIEKMSR
jgi:rfaE bifunctional protein nucleotidyltransferase chain/domain